MKNILKIIWDFLKQGKRLLIAIVIALILLLGAIVYFQHNKIVGLKDKYQTEVNLKNALIDSVHTYQNKQGEWVAERLTIQESIKNLEKMNGQLTTSQKELLDRVKGLDKNQSIITAALVETKVILSGLVDKPTVDVKDSSVVFVDSTKNLKYNIEVGHVKPIVPAILPTLKFNKFELPNKQFVEFHWNNDKKAGYPVAFSVTNSNELFKTVNIDSYAIPNLKPDKSKFAQWLEKNAKTILHVGIGVLGGGAVYYLVTH